MALLEVCAGDIDSVKAAVKGGADRVELCSALEVGGVTPSIGMIRQALEIGIKVHVLIRPRNGDFLYTADELSCMAQDVEMARELGAHGVVIGALTEGGEVDIEACKIILQNAGDMNITFHRAFDLCRNPYKAIDDIIELGCNRILTSGQSKSAEDGMEILTNLQAYAGNRLTILAGGGITPINAAKIISNTGIRELHASARQIQHSHMTFRKEGISMGTPGADEYARMTTSPGIVRQIVESIKSY